MRLSVKVKAKARKNSVEITGDGVVVCVTAPATKGKANEAVSELLARHFGIAKSKVILIRGDKSREKLFEIIGS